MPPDAFDPKPVTPARHRHGSASGVIDSEWPCVKARLEEMLAKYDTLSA